MVLNAVGSVHAVEVWMPQTCCPSCCQNVIMWESWSAKTEKNPTQSRSWRASVPPWISANSPERGRPLPNHKTVRRLTSLRSSMVMLTQTNYILLCCKLDML